MCPDFETTKSSILSRNSQNTEIVTKKIQSGNTELTIEEDCYRRHGS